RRTAALLLHARCRDVAPKDLPSALSQSQQAFILASGFQDHTEVLYSITKHPMRRSADEIGATSISFRPKVFSDPASVVDWRAYFAVTLRGHSFTPALYGFKKTHVAICRRSGG